MVEMESLLNPLEQFRQDLEGNDCVARLQGGLIGDGITIDGPFGKKPLVYADYVASGRALRQVEDFVATHVLPYYANTHTEESYCGAYSTQLREDARNTIARLVGAGPDCNVIFTGSGATAGLNRIVNLLDIAAQVRAGKSVRILVGPYEHHSNLLPWRESGAEVIEVPEAATGGPDMAILEQHLVDAKAYDMVVGSFSAASNVTGIVTDTDAVTALLKRHGALAIWDYAGGAPYLPMAMEPREDCRKDAIVFSGHKFPGGPGASGVTVLRDTVVRRATPTLPGGGSVSYVTPWSHAYSANVSEREEAGTPNVIGDIRAVLAMLVKDAIGDDFVASRGEELRQRALAVWSKNPAIEILGNPRANDRLPIFSFRIRDKDGVVLHHQLFTRMLSDVYGIQARGGCACAGPYGHTLLGIGRAASDAILERLKDAHEIEKPGWVRLNFSYLLSDEKADYIVRSVDDLARRASDYARDYASDGISARFEPMAGGADDSDRAAQREKAAI
ncbi:aminotransferase class V-fold PLP-dependent enzyme [Maritimibacter fusiformis]|uniref:Aminotransferase class V-fold PLP-dependent enzyme n=2 Tax=Maritimibacter fusiformis TaxID=2603819 RepID=A0A5D0RL34_9RHOB|nr:aminotransferase class V-fold PLP-dependent enzyme [Maritimibacter fusiformis]